MPQCLKTVLSCCPDCNSVVPIRLNSEVQRFLILAVGLGWFGSVSDCRLRPLRFFCSGRPDSQSVSDRYGGCCSFDGTYPSLFAPTEILSGECYITRATTWWITGNILCRSPALEY